MQPPFHSREDSILPSWTYTDGNYASYIDHIPVAPPPRACAAGCAPLPPPSPPCNSRGPPPAPRARSAPDTPTCGGRMSRLRKYVPVHVTGDFDKLPVTFLDDPVETLPRPTCERLCPPRGSRAHLRGPCA
eukprot:1201971-Pyramimonas_sp.AAC.2